jgi:hypothetical protein
MLPAAMFRPSWEAARNCRIRPSLAWRYCSIAGADGSVVRSRASNRSMKSMTIGATGVLPSIDFNSAMVKT